MSLADMAVIWEKRSASSAQPHNIDVYQVRSAGRSRRLYTNGVFHSQYNPHYPAAGSVWDLLLLPAFFHPPGALQRVLVLGVGGGAVLKQLQHFLQPASITGVELNPVHLQVARRFFEVKGKCFQLYEADAVAWLKAYRGPKFDLIIDDLFGDMDGIPARAVAAEPGWCRLLQRRLASDGSLVMNFDTPAGLAGSAWLADPEFAGSWQQRLRFSTPLYENAVGLFTRQPTSLAQFRHHLQQFKQLDQGRSSCRLNFRVAKI
ncbi:hypothetical protein G8764_01955 [Pseudomaricurvus alcaniphilus]|uniref:spermine/spermidine synthase domain-containing protein n=1 Tax=Pseudomaricurvus alcaniphilus TaxID=1166482 RepID=UPI001407F754|nr:hypothetical protein [Pseudomaricurvus alcaniphilus]